MSRLTAARRNSLRNRRAQIGDRRDLARARAFQQQAQRLFAAEVRAGRKALNEATTVGEALTRYALIVDVAGWERLCVATMRDAMNQVWEQTQLETAGVVFQPSPADRDRVDERGRRWARMIIEGNLARVDRMLRGSKGFGDDLVDLFDEDFIEARSLNIGLDLALDSASMVEELATINLGVNLGVRPARVWTTRGDSRVREWHEEADGQIDSVDGFFKVGGERLSRPQDPAGSLWNIIKCRCKAPAFIG